MDEQKKYNPKYSRDPEPWDEGSWQTGSTQPPKDRGGTMAVLLILMLVTPILNLFQMEAFPKEAYEKFMELGE